ncbi:MAG: riboflavin biosynthesis protein RibF [Candidatus Enterosoma sp.]|nr:riboflavin biosynthesis protein RibF [Candidatus Enterosoma sp.]
MRQIITMHTKITAEWKVNGSLVIGLFDGVHLGHQELIQEAKKDQREITCLTFSSAMAHSIEHKSGGLLLTEDEKEEKLKELGISRELVLPFDKETKNTSKEAFLSFLQSLSPTRIIVGEDFTFGKNIEGKAKDLFSLKEKGIEITILSLKEQDGEKISSSRIRRLLLDGNVEKAKELLSYPFFYTGEVKAGKHNGKRIGFPTVNIEVEPLKVKLKEGVYLTKTSVLGHTYLSMTNVGNHPTIDPLSTSIIETYLLGFDEEIYGKTIRVEFFSFLRPQQKFNSVNELHSQLQQDQETCIRLAKEMNL